VLSDILQKNSENGKAFLSVIECMILETPNLELIPQEKNKRKIQKVKKKSPNLPKF
jgi:hypothetical protein